MQNARNTILITAALLLSIGVVMIYSAIGVQSSLLHHGDSTFLPRKHLLHVTLALAGLVGCSLLDYRWLRRLAVPLVILTGILLLAVLLPGIGHTANHARRWFRIGSFSFQPSELAKYALIVFIATFAVRRPGGLRDFRRGFLPVIAVVALLGGLIVAEKDAGTPIFIATTCGILLLVAGARIKHFAPCGALAALALIAVITLGLVGGKWSHVSGRIGEFIHSVRYGTVANPAGSGYQITQSLLALGSGGFTGTGLGRGLQKLGFLPEQHTDFIFSILGEESGFAGTALVVALFTTFAFAGLQIAKSVRADPFGSLLAYGITLIIALQAAANMAVVTHLVPTKGIGLPFISKGGSAILFQCCAVGVLVNIANRFRNQTAQRNPETMYRQEA